MELSGKKMFPKQDEGENDLHLWTLRPQANAVSNGVSIRHYCRCRVGLRIVEGTGFIELERIGLHHINSHVGRMMCARKSIMPKLLDGDEVPELMTPESEDDAYSEDDDESSTIPRVKWFRE